MAIEMTKKHLVAALADESNKVVALSGRWGTGKSYLCAEVQKESKDEKVKNAIYISLFGLANMDQVKLKVVQGALPVVAENPQLVENLKKGSRIISKVLEGVHESFSALRGLGREVVMLLTPTILEDRMIVLDDIERKQSELDVGEILGFINEFTQCHKVRFLLILNTDCLEDKSLWETLREKVIDIELKLDPLPEEAFDIATQLVPPIYAKKIKESVLGCHLTNIRIIQKVIRSVNRILDNRNDLSDALLARVIPSTVLLSAIYYRGIDDGPTMEYVLSANSLNQYFKQQEKKVEETKESKHEAQWARLLDRLGISSCGKYELLIVDFLETGLFERDDISKIIDQYAEEECSMVAREVTNKFLDDFRWDHHLTDEKLVERSKELEPYVVQMGPYTLTNVCEKIDLLPNGQPISDAMIKAWIKNLKYQEIKPSDEGFYCSDIKALRPLIEAEINAKNVHTQEQVDLYNVCEYVKNYKIYTNKHKSAMRSSSSDDFERLIKSLEKCKLKIFFDQMIEFLTQKDVYGEDFGAGADHFAEACRNIVNEPDAGRLGNLIKMLFDNAGISDILAPPDDAAAPKGSTEKCPPRFD